MKSDKRGTPIPPDHRGSDECRRLAKRIRERCALGTNADFLEEVVIMPALVEAYAKGTEIGAEYALRRPTSATAYENTCEHGDHQAPKGKRFCSDACLRCEHESRGATGCDGICASDAPAPTDATNMVRDMRCPECGGALTSHVIVTRHARGACSESFVGPEIAYASVERPDYPTSVLATALLGGARALVELGWTKGDCARDASGNAVYPTSADAWTWCISGAMDRAGASYSIAAREEARARVWAAIGLGEHVGAVAEFNDRSDLPTVLAMFDKAIGGV